MRGFSSKKISKPFSINVHLYFKHTIWQLAWQNFSGDVRNKEKIFQKRELLALNIKTFSDKCLKKKPG